METMIRPPRTGMEVFKLLPEGTLCELINNNIIMSPSPKWKHQDIVVNILTALKNFISQHNIGKILSDVDVYIDEENVYRPDIMFIANDQMDILGEDGYIHGVPALIIEVLSKGTKRYDKGEKKEVYEKHGVKEYWLIDTDTLQCKGFINENNKFKEIETTNKNFVIHLFELKIELEQ